MHIRVQQRNGKKSLTTIQVPSVECTLHPGSPWCGLALSSCAIAAMAVPMSTHWPEVYKPYAQGLDKSFDYKKILKAFKKGKLMLDVICHSPVVSKPACQYLHLWRYHVDTRPY